MSLLTEGYRYMSGDAVPNTTPEEQRADQIGTSIASVVDNLVPHTKAGSAPLDDRLTFEAGLVDILWATFDHCKDWKLARIGSEEGRILVTNSTGDMKRVRINTIPKNLKQSLRWTVADSVEMLARGFTTYEDLQIHRNNALRRIKGSTVTNVLSGGMRSTAGNALPHAIHPDRRTKEE